MGNASGSGAYQFANKDYAESDKKANATVRSLGFKKNSGKTIVLRKAGEPDMFLEYKKSQYQMRRGDKTYTVDKATAVKNISLLYHNGYKES